MKWLKLTTRVDSDSAEKKDGTWSYPCDHTIIIWYNCKGYRFKSTGLTRTILKVFTAKSIHKPLTVGEGNYIYVSTEDLLRNMENPTFRVEPSCPRDYSPAELKIYKALPEFGEF